MFYFSGLVLTSATNFTIPVQENLTKWIHGIYLDTESSHEAKWPKLEPTPIFHYGGEAKGAKIMKNQLKYYGEKFKNDMITQDKINRIQKSLTNSYLNLWNVREAHK